MSNLFQRLIVDWDVYLSCGLEFESIDHMLLFYPFVTSVWFHSLLRFSLDLIQHKFTNCCNDLMDKSHIKEESQIPNYVVCFAWSILRA